MKGPVPADKGPSILLLFIFSPVLPFDMQSVTFLMDIHSNVNYSIHMWPPYCMW